MKGYSNVVKEKSVNKSSVSDSYTKKWGGDKFSGDSSQGTGLMKDKDPMKHS